MQMTGPPAEDELTWGPPRPSSWLGQWSTHRCWGLVWPQGDRERLRISVGLAGSSKEALSWCVMLVISICEEGATYVTQKKGLCKYCGCWGSLCLTHQSWPGLSGSYVLTKVIILSWECYGPHTQVQGCVSLFHHSSQKRSDREERNRREKEKRQNRRGKEATGEGGANMLPGKMRPRVLPVLGPQGGDVHDWPQTVLK